MKKNVNSLDLTKTLGLSGSKSTLALIKQERKKAEEEHKVLANRIALLKQEEIKTRNKIEITKKKAFEIYTLKKRNEDKQKAVKYDK